MTKAEQSKKYYWANKEEINAASKNRYWEKRDDIVARRIQIRDDNRQQAEVEGRDWKVAEFVVRKAYRERYKLNNPEAFLLSGAKQRAENAGMDFNITEEDIVIPSHCPVFHFPLVWRSESSGMKMDDSPSIDRIDSTKGYIKDNVQVISWKANRLKQNATLEDVEKLYNHMKQQVHNQCPLQ